jgi:putative ABC transport system substrate-binding protein
MTTLRRRAVAATVTLLSLAVTLSILAALTDDGEAAGKVYRVGYLASGSGAVEPFRQGLRELRWVEGQNIAIDYRFAGGRHDRLPDLAAELVRLKVDVLVAGPTQFAVAAKNATGTIPIVMWAVGDPVGAGLIVSLARPGGNVTGLSFAVDAGTAVKGLELLTEAVPKVRRVAVLSNPANASVASVMRDVKVAARSLGVQLQIVEARDPGEFNGAFAAMVKERAAALLVVTDHVFHLHRARLVDLAAKNRLSDQRAGNPPAPIADIRSLFRSGTRAACLPAGGCGPPQPSKSRASGTPARGPWCLAQGSPRVEGSPRAASCLKSPYAYMLPRHG